MEKPDVEQLQKEIQTLQERLLSLRASRRLLMTMLTAEQGRRAETVRKLEEENRRLKRRNLRMARMAWAQAASLGSIGPQDADLHL